MPYDYERLIGKIHPEDSEAVRGYKAGYGAFAYSLRNAGWSPEQIRNSLRTLFEMTGSVFAEEIAAMGQREPDLRFAAGLYSAESVLIPLPDAAHCQCFRCPSCPCKPLYCNACVPEETY